MLFIDERFAVLLEAPAPSVEVPPFCASANVLLDNAKTIASVIIETFMECRPIA
jgi:hypothetical protein